MYHVYFFHVEYVLKGRDVMSVLEARIEEQPLAISNMVMLITQPIKLCWCFQNYSQKWKKNVSSHIFRLNPTLRLANSLNWGWPDNMYNALLAFKERTLIACTHTNYPSHTYHFTSKGVHRTVQWNDSFHKDLPPRRFPLIRHLSRSCLL